MEYAATTTPPDERVDPCAQRVIDKCGGVKELARLTGIHFSGIYRWTKPTSQGGCGGIIPAPSRAIIRQLIRARKLPLTPADLLEGVDW